MAAVVWSIIATGAVLPATHAVRDGLTQHDAEVYERRWYRVVMRALTVAVMGAMVAGFLLSLVGLGLLAVGVIE